MSRLCPDDRLEALLDGGLEASAAQRLGLHLAICRVCAEELRLLEAERALFARRAPAQPPLPANFFRQTRALALARRAPPLKWGLAQRWAELAGAAVCAVVVGMLALPFGTGSQVRLEGRARENLCRLETGAELQSTAEGARVCVESRSRPALERAYSPIAGTL